MWQDRVALSILVLAFAVLATTHVALLLGLARRAPRWRALFALLIPPLAPWWGWQERLCGRCAVWLASMALYAVTRSLAFR